MKVLTLALALFSLLNAGALATPQENQERALIAYMRVQPGTEQKFLDEAKYVIAESQKESGNIIYYLHQSTTNPQQFVFYELFKSNADLQYHRNSKHVKTFLKAVESITLPGQFILEEYKLQGELR